MPHSLSIHLLEKQRINLAAMVLASAFCAPAFAGGPASEAYRSLRQLDSRTEAGISYSEFRSEWGRTLGIVNIALEDSTSSKVSTALSEAKVAYADLAAFWQCKIQMRNSVAFVLRCVDLLSPGLLTRHPVVAAFLSDKTQLMGDEGAPATSTALSALMGDASKRVQQLGILLKKK